MRYKIIAIVGLFCSLALQCSEGPPRRQCWGDLNNLSSPGSPQDARRSPRVSSQDAFSPSDNATPGLPLDQGSTGTGQDSTTINCCGRSVRKMSCQLLTIVGVSLTLIGVGTWAAVDLQPKPGQIDSNSTSVALPPATSGRRRSVKRRDQ